MVAVDVLKPNREHDPQLRDQVIQAAFHHGLLLLGCGESALRFCPPLCITSEQVQLCLRILDDVLIELQSASVEMKKAAM